MLDRPATPPATLIRAYDIATSYGLHYVYTGNIHDPIRGSTYCHSCGARLIGRDWYAVGVAPHRRGRCRSRGARCAGVFDGRPGRWGARRLPVRLADVAGASPLARDVGGDQRPQPLDHAVDRDAEIAQLAVRDRIADALEREQQHRVVARGGRRAPTPQGCQQLELATALAAIERARLIVGGDQGPQAGAQAAPGAMHLEHGVDDAAASSCGEPPARTSASTRDHSVLTQSA